MQKHSFIHLVSHDHTNDLITHQARETDHHHHDHHDHSHHDHHHHHDSQNEPENETNSDKTNHHPHDAAEHTTHLLSFDYPDLPDYTLIQSQISFTHTQIQTLTESEILAIHNRGPPSYLIS